MAQNQYLQNLLGINQGGTGLYGYNYSLPTYNNLLSQGLTEAQIAGYDPRFSTFNQFPYKAKANPQQNYAQYEVVPQVDGQVTEEEDTETTIDYSNQGGGGGSNTFDTISTQQYGDIRDNTPETLNIANVPFNQMSEQELMEYGQRKGYIGEDGTLLGPMQVSGLNKMGLMGMALSTPAQMMNDKKYKWFRTALQNKKMMLGGAVDSPSFASFSPSYQKAQEMANLWNDQNYNAGFSGQVKIPGTHKSVNALFDQFVPLGKGGTDIVYKTSTGGHYTNDGKFQTGYGQTTSGGSMTDAVDTLKAAAISGNYTIIPDKFNQAWVDKMIKAETETVSKEQKDMIKSSWNKIKSGKSKIKQKPDNNNNNKKSKSTPKTKNTNKIKDKIESKSNTYTSSARESFARYGR